MAAFEVIALDTATPQLRAPGAADTYTFPRAVEMPLGTANGVLYLNGSKVVTSGSGLTFDGFDLAIGNAGGLALFKRASDGLSVGRVGSRSGTDISVFNAGGVTAEFVAGANELRFNVGGSEQMRLTSTGLGIGTNNPTAKLTVLGAAAFSRIGFNANAIDVVSTAQSFMRFQSTGGDFYVGTESGTGGAFFPSSTAYAAILYNSSATPMHFYTAGTLRATLDSSGNLGLGVTPSAWASLALQVGSYAGLTQNNTLGSAELTYNCYRSSGSTWNYINSDTATRYRQWNSTHVWFTAPSGTAGNAISFTQALTLTAASNLKLGGTADRATTAGTNHLDIFNGTAPVGTLANGISIYSNAGEAYVMDAAGNATLFSPHDAETNEWIFRSKHTPTGKVLKIDVERLLRFVNDHFGLDAVQEFVEA
jgi:hypothetical protein